MKPLFLFLFVVIAFSNCIENKIDNSTGYTLKWQTEDKLDYDTHHAPCQFTLINNTSEPLKDWTLYFNQIPRSLVNSSNSTPVQVSHINGDFFKATPMPGTEIASGDSIQFDYTMNYFILKDSDTPLAPYLIIQKENSEDTIGIDDFYKKPLKWHTIASNFESNKAIPLRTNAENYQRNAALTQLSATDILPIVPQPKTYNLTEGQYTISNATSVHIATDELKNEAKILESFFKDHFNIALKRSTTNDDNGISLSLDKSLDPEAYDLTINGDGITIKGGSATGVFYGVQSLFHLIPVEAYGDSPPDIKVAQCNISDEPRFAFRGLLIDVARNFQSIDQLKKMVDLVAFYKLNKLQLILTEDEAWRIETPSLPELTQVGAVRGHTIDDANHIQPSYGSGPFTQNDYGTGHYTREEFVAFLEYATNRHVQIVPTINMPAHSRAAKKAMEHRYRTFMKSGNKEKANEYRLANPSDKSVYSSAQRYTDNVVDISSEAAYRFFKTVISDLQETYRQAGLTLDYMHIGGDEVPRGSWTGLDSALELIQKDGLVDQSANLHLYFFRRALEYLHSQGINAGGWEEVAMRKSEDGKENVVHDAFVDERFVPYVWNTQGAQVDLGYRMANKGYQVVLCNVQNLYFDLAYDASPDEPGLYWGGYVDGSSAWNFQPMSLLNESTDDFKHQHKLQELSVQSQDNILGIQGQMWGETVRGGDMLEYYALPKLFGLAERAWHHADWEGKEAAQSRNAWNQFANTIGQQEMQRLPYLFGGFNSRIPPPAFRAENGIVKVNVAYPGLDIRYAMDKAPDANSPMLKDQTSFVKNMQLSTFNKDGEKSKVVIVK